MVEHQSGLRAAEASRRLCEHKRDFLKLREEVSEITLPNDSRESDIQKNSDAIGKMEKQAHMDEQKWKAQLDPVYSVFDTRVSEEPFEELKRGTVSLTKGVAKVAATSPFKKKSRITQSVSTRGLSPDPFEIERGKQKARHEFGFEA